MRPQNLSERIRYKSRLSPTVALGLMCAAGLVMLTQGPLTAQAATDAGGGMEFQVLDVTTGSGSRSQEAAKPQIQFEVLDVATGSGMGLKGQQEIVPAVTPVLVAEPAPSESAPVLTAQKKKAAAAPAKAAETEVKAPAAPDREAIFAAMDSWHQQTLAGYSYDIASLKDPFLPIEEVRGPKPESVNDDEFKKRPPILQLELSQLKLVAITTLSDRAGSALASFEDATGTSYILRAGDLIGRNKGRITSIEPSQVTVEEPPRGLVKEPIITEIRLNILNNSGLTRESSQQNQSETPTE